MSVNYIDKSTGDLIRVAGGGNDILYADSPIGSIIPFGGTTAPDGFLLCNGDQVSKTTYSELYAVIGDSFKGAKADPASGNFYLPDLREVALKGVGTNYAYAINNHGTIDNVGGFMEDRLQNHTHAIDLISGGSSYVNGVSFSTSGTPNADVTRWIKNNGRSGDTTEVKAVGVNYIIKATQTGVPADFAPVDVVENGNMKAVTSNAVYDAITGNDVPATYYTPTAPTGDVAPQDCWYMRKGNIVTVSMGIISFSSGTSNVFTLPAKLRPTKGRVFAQAGGNTESGTGAGTIGTDGVITIGNNSGKAGFFATWTYCVE